MSDIIDWDLAREWLEQMRANNPCEHCRARTPHFHENGTGHIYTENGSGIAISYYHQSWGQLTDHDQDLPGYQWSRYARHTA